MTPNQKIASERNWNKRIITGHTAALKTTLRNNGLSNFERDKVINICNLCENLLSEWSKTLEAVKE